MRIIAGELRGRMIKAPQGKTTRPTTDRVRESLMSTLVSARGGFEGAVVLDAFAGSGALGLEALSRGASQAVFFEKDAAVFRVLKDNVATLEVASSRALLFCGEVKASLGRVGKTNFDMVFLDPPYSFPVDEVVSVIDELERRGLLADGALIVYEHEKGKNFVFNTCLNSVQWEMVSEKVYGDTALSILRYQKKDALI